MTETNQIETKILVIDDNKQIHLDFKKVLLIAKEEKGELDKFEKALLGDSENLQQQKYTIDCAFQGEEGLKMVEESLKKDEPYAVAFIDVRMPPGWDGIETISRIWKIYPDLQVVICTAYSDYSWDEIIQRIGYSDKLFILKKPFDNIEVRQLTFALSKKWELTRIARMKMSDLGKNVEERTKELSETKKKLQNLYDYAPDMYFSVAPDGTVLSVNQFGAEYLGYKQEELIGGSVWVIVYKDDLKKTQKQVKDIFEKKLIKKELEFRKIRKDSSIIWVNEKTHLFLDETGNPKELLIMCRDVTERKQTEKELQYSENKYRTMVEFSNDMIWTLDTKGNFVYINRKSEEITGHKIEEAIGKTFEPLILKDDLKMVEDVFIKTLQGKPQRYEVRIYDSKNRILFLSVNTAPILKDGEVIGTVSFGRDITKRKQIEKKMNEKLNELQLFYDIAKDREARIIELKDEVNKLREQLGEKYKYGV
jgi:PAS domain S-box-containing protein